MGDVRGGINLSANQIAGLSQLDCFRLVVRGNSVVYTGRSNPTDLAKLLGCGRQTGPLSVVEAGRQVRFQLGPNKAPLHVL